MRLIFIHGRGQQLKDPQELRELWINSLKIGLSKTDLTIPEDVEIVMPYYGDLLNSLISQTDQTEVMNGIIVRGRNYDFMIDFYIEFLNELSVNGNLSIDSSTSIKIDEIERGPLNWPWVLRILRFMDETTSFGDFSIKQFTQDVYLYSTSINLRREIDEFISSSFNDKNSVVVGHSLESIIGYNVLRNTSSLKVEKYITLGSPLGLKSIKSKLDNPILMPKSIKNGWFNAFDKTDIVALNPLDSVSFNIDPPIINKEVNNFTSNRHGIQGYLEDYEVARVIHEALKSK